MVKIFYLIAKRPDLSDEQFHRHWREVHAPLALRIPSLRRYVQCHVLPETYQDGTPVYDGVAELWWPDCASLEKAAVSPEFRVEQLTDALQFVDVDHLEGFLVEENRVIWP